MRNAECGVQNRWKNQEGASIIAAIFIIVVLAFMGVIFVSMIGTDSITSVNDLQAEQALSVAEGGLEYGQRAFAQNLTWYRSTVDPVSIPSTVLGNGNFTTITNIPATMLRTRIPTAVSVAPMRVYTTSRFPTAGVLQVDDDIAGGAEYIRYTGISGDTFTGITRNVTVGTVTGAAGSFDRGATVYPVTTLITALTAVCTGPASFSITAHTKFLDAGTIDIEGEEISYTGSSTAGGNMTLTGVQRCQNGTLAAAHAAGRPVTPMLVDGASPDYEIECIATGAVGGAVRITRKTVQR